MGTTRRDFWQEWQTFTSPCRSCKKPSVKWYNVRSRRAFFWSRAPQCGQMNSTLSCCGSRSRAAQPVRRTPIVSGLRRSMGASLLRSTSTNNKMRRLSLGYGFCNLFIKSHLQLIPKNESRILTTRTTLLESHGNLSLRPVSNAVRTRATSHPCERGAGFLEKLEQPPGHRRRKFFCPLTGNFVEVCDAARASRSSREKFRRRSWFPTRVSRRRRRRATHPRTARPPPRLDYFDCSAKRSSCRAHSRAPFLQDAAHRACLRDTGSALFPLPERFAQFRRSAGSQRPEERMSHLCAN